MFGYFKWRKTVLATGNFISGLLAPLGEKMPNQVFGDGYVLGFLQSVTMQYIVEIDQIAATPGNLQSVFTEVIGSFVPDLKSRLSDGMAAINESHHPMHEAYTLGRRDGDALMKSRRGIVSAADGRSALDGFHNFIRRNYLSADGNA